MVEFLTLLVPCAAILAGAAGYLVGTRQHAAEEAQASWVHDLVVVAEPLAIEAAPTIITAAGLPVRDLAAAPPEVEFGVDEEAMVRLLAWLQEPETALTAELAALDFGMPIFAQMGPLPLEPELVSVG